MHPQTPKEPDFGESSPSVISESSWHSEDWKKGNGIVYSVRPRRGTWGTRGWSISLCEIVKQLIWKKKSKHTKDKEVNGIDPHSFMRENHAYLS